MNYPKLLKFTKKVTLETLKFSACLAALLLFVALLAAIIMAIVYFSGVATVSVFGEVPNSSSLDESIMMAGVLACLVLCFAGKIIYEVSVWMVKTWKNLDQ